MYTCLVVCALLFVWPIKCCCCCCFSTQHCILTVSDMWFNARPRLNCMFKLSKLKMTFSDILKIHQCHCFVSRCISVTCVLFVLDKRPYFLLRPTPGGKTNKYANYSCSQTNCQSRPTSNVLMIS